jgi:hypothetical protein
MISCLLGKAVDLQMCNPGIRTDPARTPRAAQENSSTVLLAQLQSALLSCDITQQRVKRV